MGPGTAVDYRTAGNSQQTTDVSSLPSAIRHLPSAVLLSLDNIARAARDIDAVFRGTPQFEAEALGKRIGARIVLKVETANPVRSFKGRGADFYMREQPRPPAAIVTASAGNFGQGLAWAARARGVALTVFAAETANPLKVERMRSLGAVVELRGVDFDEAKSHARAFGGARGVRFVEDGREPAIAEGAGSIAVELCNWPEPIGAVIVPLGNGALLGGIGAWMKARSPATRVVGVCASRAPAMRESLLSGRPVESASANTIADGIAVRVPVPEALDYLRPVVDEVMLVSEDSLLAATRIVMEETGLLAEPAGAAGIAALLEYPALRAAGLVATPLCGSNVTP